MSQTARQTEGQHQAEGQEQEGHEAEERVAAKDADDLNAQEPYAAPYTRDAQKTEAHASSTPIHLTTCLAHDAEEAQRPNAATTLPETARKTPRSLQAHIAHLTATHAGTARLDPTASTPCVTFTSSEAHLHTVTATYAEALHLTPSAPKHLIQDSHAMHHSLISTSDMPVTQTKRASKLARH